MKIKKGKTIKIINAILLKFIYILIGLCFGYNIIFTVNTTITQNDYFELFGISFFCMKSDLMQDDINMNDLVIVKKVEESKLQEGDIIAYSINGNTRINKIIKKETEYITRSNKNYNPDIEKISYDQVIGKMIVNIPVLGIIISIFQSKITNAIILVILILYFLYNRYLVSKKNERARKKKIYENNRNK